MPNPITVLRNLFSIRELRQRLFYTFFYLAIFSLGTQITLPGLNPALSANFGAQAGTILAHIEKSLGAKLSNRALLSLGITPYISVSLAIQVASLLFPYFQRLRKEGQAGQNKITQITRLCTIPVALLQAVMYVQTFPKYIISPSLSYYFFFVLSVIILTAGTLFTVWLAENITYYGLGNGSSLLIAVGIISKIPKAVKQEITANYQANYSFLRPLLTICGIILLITIIVGFTQGVRKIPLRYAKHYRRPIAYVRPDQYLPLKINTTGAMPVIFAQTLLLLPIFIAKFSFWKNTTLARNIVHMLQNNTSWQYNLLMSLLVILFTFGYTSLAVNPTKIANDLRRNGGFIPGIKPGRSTSKYLDGIITRLLLPSALFLATIAFLPTLAFNIGLSQHLSQFFGGTSLLILVGVALDLNQQIESYLLMHHYNALMHIDSIL